MFRNLFKNVLRSLRKNKVSTIGLTFLVFISLSIFTVLQSTTKNINNSYNNISLKSNLHDLTISENYNTGKIDYKMHHDHQGKSSDGYDVIWPEQKAIPGSKFLRTYWYEIDLSVVANDSLIKITYDKYLQDPIKYEKLTKLFYPIFEIESTTRFTYLVDDSRRSPLSYSEINEQLGIDRTAVNNNLSSFAQMLHEYLTGEQSPMVKYLQEDEEVSKLIDFRPFISIDVNNSPDKIFYKVVQSNYEDIVDFEVLFDQNKSFLNWKNFSLNNWKPGFSFDDENEKTVDYLKQEFKLFDQVKADEKLQKDTYKKLQIFLIGFCSNNELIDLVQVIVNKLSTNNDWNQVKTDYEKLLNDYKFDQFFDLGYKLTWSGETKTGSIPFAWYIQDWTARFAIVSPQYLESKNKKPISADLFIHNESFINWKQNHSSINDLREQFIGWMNSLKQKEIDDLFNEWKNDHEENIINVNGGTPYIILSSGITGDFIYPVVSLDRPIPNPKEEVVVFANTNGYQRIFDIVRGNPVEKYLVVKVKNKKNINYLLDKINLKAQEIMSWPKDIKAAYLTNDTTNVLNASAFRIAYIPDLVDKINYISWILTLFVVFIGLLISAIIVRRYIENSKTIIGILIANGVTKWAVAFSLTAFALIPSFIGGVAGYLFGTFLQKAALGLFSSYWTLPTAFLAISWQSTVLAFCIPFVVFFGVSIISTLWVLREKAVFLMKPGIEFKTNLISRLVKKPLAKANIITKFRVCLSLNSLWRLAILCTMNALTISSVVFGFAINHKFHDAIVTTSQTRNYEFAIDLYSPTVQGGQYLPTSANEIGKSGFVYTKSEGLNWIPNIYTSKTTLDDSYNYIDDSYASSIYSKDNGYKQYYNSTFNIPIFGNEHREMFKEQINVTDTAYHGNVFLPLMADATGQKKDLFYMKNRVSSKMILNYLVGISSLHLATNPWDICVSLLPENAKNTSDSAYERLLNDLGELVYLGTDPQWNNEQFKKFIKKQTISDSLVSYYIDKDAVRSVTSIGLNKDYVQMMWKAYRALDTNWINKDYQLTYNQVPLTDEEETYTYLLADINHKRKKQEVKIMGIKPETTYFNLVDQYDQDLAKTLIIDDKTNYNNNIVINSFVAYKYDLQVGDTVSFKIKNKADRFIHLINKTEDSNNTCMFTVSGITKSAEGEEWFINQQLANKMLGLKSQLTDESLVHNYYINYEHAIKESIFGDDQKNTKATIFDINQWKNNDHSDKNITPYGFNGVLTKNNEGSYFLNRGLFFYSSSGLWQGSDSITSNASKEVLAYGANLQIANEVTGFKNTEIGQKIQADYDKWQASKSEADRIEMTKNINQFVNQMAEIFGNTTLTLLLKDVMAKEAKESVYLNIALTIQDIQTAVLATIWAMTIFIVLLMSTLIINDAKRLAALLKSIGYTDKENALSFMSIYIPVLLIGVALAVPLSFFFLNMFQLTMVSGVGILINVSPLWWHYLTAILGVMSIFTISTISTWISLKRDKLINMIK